MHVAVSNGPGTRVPHGRQSPCLQALASPERVRPSAQLQPDHNGRIFTLRNQKMLP
jgi:hypothetical protein